MTFRFDTVFCKHLAYSHVTPLLFAEYPTALPPLTDEAVDRVRLCLTSTAESRIISINRWDLRFKTSHRWRLRLTNCLRSPSILFIESVLRFYIPNGCSPSALPTRPIPCCRGWRDCIGLGEDATSGCSDRIYKSIRIKGGKTPPFYFVYSE